MTLGDQSVYEADVVGYDEDKDVAVLHIDAPEDKLRPLPVGSSSDLLVGQKVFAIGNPVRPQSMRLSFLICTCGQQIVFGLTGGPGRFFRVTLYYKIAETLNPEYQLTL